MGQKFFFILSDKQSYHREAETNVLILLLDKLLKQLPRQ